MGRACVLVDSQGFTTPLAVGKTSYAGSRCTFSALSKGSVGRLQYWLGMPQNSTPTLPVAGVVDLKYY